jgi:hypothetical protein
MHRYPKREQKNRYTARLSPIISVLLIPIRVSDALGYARNNSECYLSARISPRTSCKDTNIICNFNVEIEKSEKKFGR